MRCCPSAVVQVAEPEVRAQAARGGALGLGRKFPERPRPRERPEWPEHVPCSPPVGLSRALAGCPNSTRTTARDA
eukprot:3672954-Alexandrium_andersonii.AAC.1